MARSSPPGTKLTCTGTRTLIQADIDNGSVANTGTVAGSDPDGGEVSDRADEDVPLAQAPHLTLTKDGVLDAGADGRPSVGDVITYTLTATNDGNVTLTGVSISDPSLPTLVCDQPVDLAPGEKLTCTGTNAVTQGEIDDGSVENTGTVAGSDPNGGEVEDRADEQVPLDPVPHLTLVKVGELDTGADGRPSAGDVITYTLTATNDGNVTLTGVSISDPSLPTLACDQPADLAPGDRLECTGTRTLTQADVDGGSVENTGTVTGTDPNGDEVDDSADFELPLESAAQLTLDKQGMLDATKVAPNDRADVGDVVDYTLTAINDGNTSLTLVGISDESLELTCRLNGEAEPLAPGELVTLGPGGSLTCTGTRTLTQADIERGGVDNTATVTGTDPSDNKVTEGAEEHVPLAQEPHLTLEKQGVLEAGADGRPDVDDAIAYTLTATNDGNVTLKGVSISDPSLPTLDCDQPVDLAPGETLTCTGTHALTQGDINDGSVPNTATVKGSDPDGDEVSGRADEQVPVDQVPHLTLEKAGVLEAGADGLPNVGDVITYTLTVTNDGNVTLTGVSISDPSLPTLDCDQPVDLAPGETLTCTGTHPLTQGDINDGSVPNTATVAGSDPDGNELSDRADETVPLARAPHLTLTKEGTLDTTQAGPPDRADAGDVITYTLTATNDGNVTLTGVSIADSLLATLECDQPVDLAPGETLTCTGTRTLTQGEINDGGVENTATVTGTDPNGNELSDRADVERPARPAAASDAGEERGAGAGGGWASRRGRRGHLHADGDQRRQRDAAGRLDLRSVVAVAGLRLSRSTSPPARS